MCLHKDRFDQILINKFVSNLKILICSPYVEHCTLVNFLFTDNKINNKYILCVVFYVRRQVNLFFSQVNL